MAQAGTPKLLLLHDFGTNSKNVIQGTPVESPFLGRVMRRTFATPVAAASHYPTIADL